MYKPPGNPVVLELTKSHKLRAIQLDKLKAVYIELPDHTSEKRCAWCVEVKIGGGNRKYCSEICSSSAMAWAYPQKEDALKYLLLRQNWKCFSCQYDYLPMLESFVEKDRKAYNSLYQNGKKVTFELEKLPWYYFKRLKERVPKDRKPEVDHVIPISKGGQSLGLSNTVCLCYTCHKVKTKLDNSGPRKK